MKKLCFLLVTCWFSGAWAQFPFAFAEAVAPPDSLPESFVRLSGLYGAETHQWTSRALWQLNSDDFLDSLEKVDLYADLGQNLQLGFQQGLQMEFAQKMPGDSTPFAESWSAGLRTESWLALSSPREGAALALFGNAYFAGETVALDNSHYQAWRYTLLAYRQSDWWGSWPVQWSAAVVLGHEHRDYRLGQARLFTEAKGRYLELEADYRLREAFTNNPAGIAGMGAVFGWQSQWGHSHKKGTWRLSLSDVGLTYWSRGSQRKLDSTLRFSGFAVANLLELKDSLLRADADSLTAALGGQEEGAYAALHPFQVALAYRKQIGEGPHQYSAALRYRYLPGFRPRLSAGVLWRWSRHQLHSELAWGGFNAFSLGAAWQWQVAARWELQFWLSHLGAPLLPAARGGSRLGGSLQYRL